ncbi:transposase [Polaromonas sp. CG_9.7]
MRFPKEIIPLCVRWYAAYLLSYRNLEEMMHERGVHVDHSSVSRWAIKFLPLLEKVFRKHKRAVGASWRMDETCILVNGQLKYLYRAVDKGRRHHRFPALSQARMVAATRFFERRCAKTEIQRRSRWTRVAPTRRPWTGSTKTATCRSRCALLW